MNSEINLSNEESGFDERQVDTLLEPYLGDQSMVIPILQRVQEYYGYLPRPVLNQVARRMRLPLSRLYGIATFYTQFKMSPQGKHLIRFCCGTACHVRGGSKVSDKVKELLQVEVGETTADRKYTFEEVACIGACGLAPVMNIDGKTFGKLASDKIKGILDSFGEAGKGVRE